MTKTISRKTKGAIAAVAGGALLLGTAGTFALWTADDTIAGRTITTGQLALNDAEFAWEINGNEIKDDAVIVPGDVLTGTASIAPTLVGETLRADLNIESGALTGEAADQATVTWTLGTEALTGSSVEFDIAALEPGATPQALTVEIALPKGGSTTNGSQDKAWTLSDTTVTLTQS